MKKKGFTLIELLAVIVVLAIIALIATPMVLNTIDEARKGSAKSSGYGYINGLETSLASYMLRNNGVSYSAGKYDIATLNTDLDVTIKGEKPSEGKVCVSSDGTVTKASLKVNGYIISYDGKEVKNTDLKEVEDITCDGVVSGGPTQQVATNGETYKAIVYLDPTDLTKTCDASNSVSTTGTKEGCMKWYAYSDDGANYTMILDHNTTPIVTYNSTGSNSEMVEVKTEIDNLVSVTNWKVTPRLIEANEIAQITGATESLQWTSDKIYELEPVIGTSVSYFYLDGAAGTDIIWHTQMAKSQGESKYAWFFDNTYECISFGCNTSDDNNYEYGISENPDHMIGYWTSNAIAGHSDLAWAIGSAGYLSFNRVNYTNAGVRPVITISKDILK